MSFQKVKSVDSIFDEVKDYDLVLTVDAPLADALNSRLKEPRLGEFATTPRRLAYSDDSEEIDFRRDIFLELIGRTNMSWKQASYLLDQVIESWKKTGDIEKITENSSFDKPEVEQIIDVLKETRNPFSAMEQVDIDQKKVAVVAPHQFNALDRKALPNEYDTFTAFTEEEFELPEFNIFSSATEIVQALRDNITRENADNIAIVLDSEGPYQHLVESAFNLNGIPYVTKNGLSEDEAVRTFLLFLRAGLTGRRLRLRDIRPVLAHLGVKPSVKNDNKFLSEIDGESIRDFKEFMNVVEYLEFEDALSRFEDLSTTRLDLLRELLADLELLESDISEDAVDRLEYFIDNYDLETGDSDRGVVFVDPKSGAFVDRPIVFYLGMNSDWTKSIDDRPWISREEEEARNLLDFQILLQNGERNYYMVQDKYMNEEVTPCFYFNELMEEFESFTDHDHRRFEGLEEPEAEGFTRQPRIEEIERVETISQSRLNNLVNCPREYYFSQLVSSADIDYIEKGNMYHDFAEFYVNHPETVEGRGLETFVEMMLKEIRPLVDELEMDILRTEFSIGLKNIKKFIDEQEIEEAELGYEKKSNDNVFAEQFGKDISTQIAELWFEDPELGARGLIDLMKDPSHLVDYKSGRKKSAEQIVRSSNVDLFEERPNFQALMYLTAHRKRVSDETLKFSFLYFLDNLGDEVTGTAEEDDSRVTVKYYPENFDQTVSDIEVFEMLIKDVAKSNNRRKTLEKLGYPNYSSFFEDRKIPEPYSKEKLLESEFAAEFIKYTKKHVGDYKYVEKGCSSALRKLVKFRTQNYFREDLDRFEDFLGDQIENLNDYRANGFPVGDSDIDGSDYRDMIIR